MNREQQEFAQDLKKAVNDALEQLVNMSPSSEPSCVEENCVKEQPMERQIIKADYRVEITQVNNGFIVNVGCQTFVFGNIETANKYIAMYFENPSETTRKYYEGTLFK
jgi:hypothetical protein